MVGTVKIDFTVFYANVPGEPPRMKEYLPYIAAGQRALRMTNPDARYIVLTDTPTARDLYYYAESFVVPYDTDPLMLKYVRAQEAFLRQTDADLVILAGTDCIPNLSFEDALRDDHGFAITHRGPKFKFKINNVGYSADHRLGADFLASAAEILKGWPAEKQAWLGDQESWEAALGDFKPSEDMVQPVDTKVGRIWLYPCETHNHVVLKRGDRKPSHEDAYLLHFKGPRKQHLERYVYEHIVR